MDGLLELSNLIRSNGFLSLFQECVVCTDEVFWKRKRIIEAAPSDESSISIKSLLRQLLLVPELSALHLFPLLASLLPDDEVDEANDQ